MITIVSKKLSAEEVLAIVTKTLFDKYGESIELVVRKGAVKK